MADQSLERFVAAQNRVYEQVLVELRAGRKQSHWMWFVFPQLLGLGTSQTSRFYAIRSASEAASYLADPILGNRLLECTQFVLGHREKSAEAFFGPVDGVKLRSSMTLFDHVADGPGVFSATLETFFGGARDERTLQLLGGAR